MITNSLIEFQTYTRVKEEGGEDYQYKCELKFYKNFFNKMRNLLRGISWQRLLPKSIVEENGYIQGKRQLAQVKCICLCKINHKCFQVWMIGKMCNLIVSKNRSLNKIASLRKKNYRLKEGTAMHKRKTRTQFKDSRQRMKFCFV
jgi:hypothetical protein